MESIFQPDLIECPFDHDRRLRAEAPVYRDPAGPIVVSRHDLIVEVCKKPEVISNGFGKALGGKEADSPEIQEIKAQGYPPMDTLLTADPPVHTRFRKLVNKAFTQTRVEAMVPAMEATSRSLIDEFAAAGRVELRQAYAQRLPLMVIAGALGVPLADLERFRGWSNAFVARLGQMAGKEGEIAAMKQCVEFQHYFAAWIEEKRRAPTDDLLSDLVHAQVEGERPLEVAELLSILQQLLVAGNETTASAILEGVTFLLRSPEALEAWRANPTLLPNLVEEVLRLSAPTTSMWRIATLDTELAGVPIPAGTLLILRFGSGSRDEACFAGGDTFDPRRANARSHLAFGAGIHVCLGATLARRETAIAFSHLFGRLRNLRLSPGMNDFRHAPSVLLRGMIALHVDFDP